MARRVLLASLVLVLFLVPAASAHTTLKPKENEVHILSDFADDISYAIGSWDLWDIYVGEASLPGVGDGLYFHTILFGDFARKLPAETTFKATFSFKGPTGVVTRSLTSNDGNTLKGDFDALEYKKVGTDFEVVRAFVSFQSAGLAPGMEIKEWKVETFVDADLRDRAPGGYFMPRSGGKIEKPETSTVKTPTYKLAGAGTYFTAAPTMASDGTVTFRVFNSLKETSQLVKIEAPASSSWTFQAIGEPAAQLPGGKASTLQMKLIPKPGPTGLVEPVAFNLTSDAGGRVGFIAHMANGVPALALEGSVVAAGKLAAAPAESPSAGLLLLLFVLASVAVGVRRRFT